MSATPVLPAVTIPALPEGVGSRLLTPLASLVKTVREGLKSGTVEQTQAGRWTRALRLLERELAGVTAAVKHAEAGSDEPLISHASRLRSLGRQMDGYRLDFAGPAIAARLETQRRLTILVAWQIVAFASGSKASGL